MKERDYSGKDFYCDEVLSGRTPVDKVAETLDVLAFHHTRPYWPVHIVVIPKLHIPSLIDLGVGDEALLGKVLAVVKFPPDDFPHPKKRIIETKVLGPIL